MANCIRCDSCDTVLTPGAPYLSVERLGAPGASGTSEFVEVFGVRTEYDVCSAECLGQLAADLLESTC